jgi:aminotransferase
VSEAFATGLPFAEPQGAYYLLIDISSLGFATDTEAAEWYRA